MSKWTIFTTWHALHRRSIINSIQYRPRRPAFTAPSTCSASRNGSKRKYCRHPPLRSTAIPRSIRRKESYWGRVNPIGLRSCYDEGKRCAETLFFDYWRQHHVLIKVVRIFNTYGPRMHPDDGRVVSNFIIQALKGQEITVYGDGTQTRSFCFVDDLVEAMLRTMDTPDEFAGPINIGNPTEFTMLELAELVLKMTRSKSKLVFKPLPSDDPRQRQPDISLAQELLGWSPTTELEQGLERTI